jgi:hypothetical protein
MDRKLTRWIASLIVGLFGFAMQHMFLGNEGAPGTNEKDSLKKMAMAMSGYNDAEALNHLDDPVLTH